MVQTGESQALDETALQILMVAVRVARDHQVQKVAILKEKLEGLFPGQGEAVDSALRYWADYEVRKARQEA